MRSINMKIGMGSLEISGLRLKVQRTILHDTVHCILLRFGYGSRDTLPGRKDYARKYLEDYDA